MDRLRKNPKPLPEVLSTFDADEDLEPFPADFIGPKDNKLLRLREENNDMKRPMSSHSFASVTKQQRQYPARSYRIAFRHASTIAYDSLTTTIDEENAIHEQHMAAWGFNNDALATASSNNDGTYCLYMTGDMKDLLNLLGTAQSTKVPTGCQSCT